MALKSGGAEELAAKRHGDNRETQWLCCYGHSDGGDHMVKMAMVTAAMTAVCDLAIDAARPHSSGNVAVLWHELSSSSEKRAGLLAMWPIFA